MAEWTPGRPKGAINRKTKEFQALLEERGFNVAEAFLELFDEGLKQYKKADQYDHHAANAALKLLVDITKEIAAYSLPKLKSIEVKNSNPMEGMTPQEKLDLVKEYALVLEAQAKGG